VVESAVVGFPHPIKGQAIYAFVITSDMVVSTQTIKAEIIAEISDQIGSIAKPNQIQFVKGLPKTRSGKIMRRILRKIASGEKEFFGDISTLLDPAVVQQIVEGL
jgi:acetyl-CoA synthetase